MTDFATAGATAILNQFPHESCVTSKNLLAGCLAARYGARLPWLPDAYALPHQLSAFDARWRRDESRREEAAGSGRSAGGGGGDGGGGEGGGGGGGAWILKPWSSSRSRGLLVVGHEAALAAAMGSCAAAFGPRLCCEYVARPLLLRRRKFDLRLLLCVEALAPTPRAYCYRGWYARLAKAPYEGAPLHLRAAHQTVSKYDDTTDGNGGAAAAAEAEDAAEDDEAEAPSLMVGADVLAELGGDGGPSGGVGAAAVAAALVPRLHGVLADVVRVLAARAEPGARWATGHCRALYGVDVMLAPDANWRDDARATAATADAAAAATGGIGAVQPVLLEVNYSPDLEAPLRLFPRFVDELFGRLFLGDDGGAQPGGAGWDALPF